MKLISTACKRSIGIQALSIRSYQCIQGYYLSSRTIVTQQQRHLPIASSKQIQIHYSLSSLSFPPTQLRLYSSSAPTSLCSSDDDTIFAISTAPGRAGIAIIRISGPTAPAICHALTPSKPFPAPRVATVRTLYDPRPIHQATILDPSALILYFPAPKTVTGEDVVELHVHGGTATVKAVLAAIPRCGVVLSTSRAVSISATPLPRVGTAHSEHRIRYAEPGEFTRRAFMNGRLDLSQVEALSDTLSAETERQRITASRGAGGALGKRYEQWRQHLLNARGEIEALIDFSEDQHFDESPAELLGNVAKYVRELLGAIRQHERGSKRGELLRNGIRIALVGPPNVGKSSLMNLVVGREASIVSSEAGTTRDIVEVSLDIRGFLCSFADTAGFRTAKMNGNEKVGVVELEGMRRARNKAQESDFVAVLGAIETTEGSYPPQHYIHYDAETLHIAAQAKAHMIVINKTDQVSPEVLEKLLSEFRSTVLSSIPELGSTEILSISCEKAVTEDMGFAISDDAGNIHNLTDRFVKAFEKMTFVLEGQEDTLSVTGRQHQLLEECRRHLEDFVAVAKSETDADAEGDIVIAAEHLRFAANCLSRITGRGEIPDVEEVLGVIFEKFCVGK